MRIAIVDDITEDARSLQADVCRWARETQTSLAFLPVIFESGEALLASRQKSAFDVIFLDIYMDGMNGMETAKRIRETDQSCRLIFTTQTPEYAVESYDVASSYYLIKPCSYEKLSLALNRCLASVSENRPFLAVPDKLNGEPLFLYDIVYTEYTNRHILVHMKDGSCRSIAMRQKDFADALREYSCFCDCMKGILVNFQMVDQLQKDRFLMKNGQFIPISRLKYQSVREQFLQYSYEQTRRMNP